MKIILHKDYSIEYEESEKIKFSYFLDKKEYKKENFFFLKIDGEKVEFFNNDQDGDFCGIACGDKKAIIKELKEKRLF